MSETFKGLCIPGGMATHFVRVCASLAEAQRTLPELTQQQYDDIRAGKARIIGDTHNGLQYEEVTK